MMLVQTRKYHSLAVLILVILGLRTAIWGLSNLEGVDSVGEEVGARLVGLANISFLCVPSYSLFQILGVPRGSSHVRRVAQLSLFVLEICIVSGVRVTATLSSSKVAVAV